MYIVYVPLLGVVRRVALAAVKILLDEVLIRRSPCNKPVVDAFTCCYCLNNNKYLLSYSTVY